MSRHERVIMSGTGSVTGVEVRHYPVGFVPKHRRKGDANRSKMQPTGRHRLGEVVRLHWFNNCPDCNIETDAQAIAKDDVTCRTCIAEVDALYR